VKVLVTGAGGQVGRALLRLTPPGAAVFGARHADLDISDPRAVERVLGELAPQVVINAAAYTDVDKAESEPQAAVRVNVVGPRVLAEAAQTLDIRLIHVSTDFVFDGYAWLPYQVDSEPKPLSVYGRTKLDGERAVYSVLGSTATILRTAWVYDAAGHNFLTTMLRIMRDNGGAKVVADQVGTPTSADSVAVALWRLAADGSPPGMFHWTNAGVASRYDFAVAIAEEAHAAGLLPKTVNVEPIATSDYPTPARRPAYSVLDKRSTCEALGLRPVHWRVALRRVLGELTLA
jgi:dTDP-4-dehydrorhamnose reductase